MLALVLLAAALAFAGPLAAYDLWWHLKAGRLIVESGRFPHADPFSFTATGSPWVYHSWLGGVLLSSLWRAGGPTALVALRCLVTAAALGGAWLLARRRGVGPGLAAVLALAAALQLRVRALARPYLFSFVLFVLFTGLLDRTTRPRPGEPGEPEPTARAWLWGARGRLLLLPALTLLWANVHAGFLAGFLVLGAYGVGELVRLRAGRPGRLTVQLLVRRPEGARFRAMFAAGVLSVGASLGNPYGAAPLLYPFRLMGLERIRGIEEWQGAPLTGEFAVFWALLGAGALVLCGSAVRAWRSGRTGERAGRLAGDILLFGGFSVLALRGVRHVAWPLLLTPAILGHHLRAWLPRRGAEERPGRRYGAAAWGLAVVIAAMPLVRGRPLSGVSEKRLPVAASEFIADAGLQERAWHSYEWGGYLIWRFWPRRRVYIDGRCLVYGDRVLERYLRVQNGTEGWRRVLREDEVDMILLHYRDDGGEHFFREGEWRCVYWDDTAVIALRRAVARAHPELPDLTLTNPLVFEHSLSRASPRELLRELDAVLRRAPRSWTAHAFRARCLVRIGRSSGRDSDLKRALRTARKAVELNDKAAEPWRSLSEAADALGMRETAAAAAGRARRLSGPEPGG